MRRRPSASQKESPPKHYHGNTLIAAASPVFFFFLSYYRTNLLGGQKQTWSKQHMHFLASLVGVDGLHVTQFGPMKYKHQLVGGLQGSSLKGQTRLANVLSPSSPTSLAFLFSSTWTVAVMAGTLVVILSDFRVETRRSLGPWRHERVAVTTLQTSSHKSQIGLCLVQLCYLGLLLLLLQAAKFIFNQYNTQMSNNRSMINKSQSNHTVGYFIATTWLCRKICINM